MGFKFVIKQTPVPEPVAGLYIQTNPDPLNTTLSSAPGLVDGDIYTVPATSGNWYKGYSYGVDLGVAGEIAGLDCYCWVVAGDPATWYGPTWDKVGAYKSDDNSTWTLIEEIDGPPIITHMTNYFTFRFEFTTPQTARYFKFRYNDTSNYLALQGGVIARATEIEVLQV